MSLNGVMNTDALDHVCPDEYKVEDSSLVPSQSESDLLLAIELLEAGELLAPANIKALADEEFMDAYFMSQVLAEMNFPSLTTQQMATLYQLEYTELMATIEARVNELKEEFCLPRCELDQMTQLQLEVVGRALVFHSEWALRTFIEAEFQQAGGIDTDAFVEATLADLYELDITTQLHYVETAKVYAHEAITEQLVAEYVAHDAHQRMAEQGIFSRFYNALTDNGSVSAAVADSMARYQAMSHEDPEKLELIQEAIAHYKSVHGEQANPYDIAGQLIEDHDLAVPIIEQLKDEIADLLVADALVDGLVEAAHEVLTPEVAEVYVQDLSNDKYLMNDQTDPLAVNDPQELTNYIQIKLEGLGNYQVDLTDQEVQAEILLLVEQAISQKIWDLDHTDFSQQKVDQNLDEFNHFSLVEQAQFLASAATDERLAMDPDERLTRQVLLLRYAEHLLTLE